MGYIRLCSDLAEISSAISSKSYIGRGGSYALFYLSFMFFIRTPDATNAHSDEDLDLLINFTTLVF